MNLTATKLQPAAYPETALSPTDCWQVQHGRGRQRRTFYIFRLPFFKELEVREVGDFGYFQVGWTKTIREAKELCRVEILNP